MIGVPDKQYGEEIMACVILKEGVEMTAEAGSIAVRIWQTQNSRYVEFVDSFPMNAAGKILKYRMRRVGCRKLRLQEANKIETA